MAAELFALTFDATDPRRVADFWSGVLQLSETDDPFGAIALTPNPGTGFRLRFVENPYPKGVHNRAHFDLASASQGEQRATVDRALALGGRHYDVGQLPEEEHVVLADPEDNEFCVIEAGNGFLAGSGLVGCLSCDGSHATGTFWSRALDWPLVWDQGEETAIQSPAGGSKISWGGGPDDPKPPKNRIHHDLVPTADSDLATEVERLLSLGARRLDIGQGDVAWEVMADPDGNEFCLLPRPV